VLRVRHYSLRTEDCYVQWARRFIRFHGLRHPRTMGTAEVERFLGHLAVEGCTSPRSQNQALNSLLFLYAQVLDQRRAQRRGRRDSPLDVRADITSVDIDAAGIGELAS